MAVTAAMDLPGFLAPTTNTEFWCYWFRVDFGEEGFMKALLPAMSFW